MQLTSLTLWEKKKSHWITPIYFRLKLQGCPQGTRKWNVMYRRFCQSPAFELPRASSWLSLVLLSARPTSDLDEQPMLLLPFLKEHFFLVTCATNCLHRQKIQIQGSSKHFIILPSPKSWHASPVLSDRIKQSTTMRATFIFLSMLGDPGRIEPQSSRAIFPGCHGNQAEVKYSFLFSLSIWSAQTQIWSRSFYSLLKGRWGVEPENF